MLCIFESTPLTFVAVKVKMATPIVTVCASDESLACKLGDHIHEKAEDAIAQRGVFRLGVSGYA